MSRLYVLVRGDLVNGYAAAQACHVVAEHCLRPDTRWRNETIVLLMVEDEAALKEWQGKLSHATLFREPDIGDQLTALAVEGSDRVRRILRRLPLL